MILVTEIDAIGYVFPFHFKTEYGRCNWDCIVLHPYFYLFTAYFWSLTESILPPI
jgi:hypothetical protein